MKKLDKNDPIAILAFNLIYGFVNEFGEEDTPTEDKFIKVCDKYLKGASLDNFLTNVFGNIDAYIDSGDKKWLTELGRDIDYYFDEDVIIKINKEMGYKEFPKIPKA